MTFAVLRPLFRYIEQEVSRVTKASLPGNGNSPINQDALNAAASAREEARRKMLETEKRARQAEERARQTQHRQDMLRAAQARTDADRARARY